MTRVIGSIRTRGSPTRTGRNNGAAQVKKDHVCTGKIKVTTERPRLSHAVAVTSPVRPPYGGHVTAGKKHGMCSEERSTH